MQFLNEFGFTTEELQIISDLDSTQFGFIDWNDAKNFTLRDLIRRSIKIFQNIGTLIEGNSENNIKLGPNSIIKQYSKYNEADSMKNIRVLDINLKALQPFLNNEEKYPLSIAFDLNTFCKLGHLHLILEEFDKALSAYQQYLKIKPMHVHNLEFLYGIGLVYFHFNAFRWTTCLQYMKWLTTILTKLRSKLSKKSLSNICRY